MKPLIDRFASLRVTVSLLVLVLVSLAAGTIVESLHGADAAGPSRLRRGLVPRAARGLRPQPRLLAHRPLAVGPPPNRLRDHPRLDARDPRRRAHDRPREGRGPAPHLGRRGVEHGGRPARRPEAEAPVVARLPFAVRLDSFEIDYYEGTRRPAQFRSRVTVKDRRAARLRPSSR